MIIQYRLVLWDIMKGFDLMAKNTANKKKSGTGRHNMLVKVVAIVCAALMLGSVVLTVVSSL